MSDILARLEHSRKTVANYYLLNGLLLLLCFLSFPLLIQAAPVVPFAFLIASVCMFLFFTLKKRKAYTTGFKHDLVESILKEIFTDLYFDPNRGLHNSVIKNTGMMQMGNRYSSDDYIKGKYKDIAFEQADVCIQQVTTDSEGRSHTTTYFRGRWMIFDFNKNFASDLQVRESGFTYAKKKGGWFTPKEEKMKKLELEDAEFNKGFNVYASNDHEAYYILTPHIMQSMKTLRERTKGKLILCFVASRLHVGVNSNDNAFEPPIFRAIDENIVNSIKQEISVITRFVDELKLDRNIYKQG